MNVHVCTSILPSKNCHSENKIAAQINRTLLGKTTYTLQLRLFVLSAFVFFARWQQYKNYIGRIEKKIITLNRFWVYWPPWSWPARIWRRVAIATAWTWIWWPRSWTTSGIWLFSLHFWTLSARLWQRSGWWLWNARFFKSISITWGIWPMNISKMSLTTCPLVVCSSAKQKKKYIFTEFKLQKISICEITTLQLNNYG